MKTQPNSRGACEATTEPSRRTSDGEQLGLGGFFFSVFFLCLERELRSKKPETDPPEDEKTKKNES